MEVLILAVGSVYPNAGNRASFNQSIGLIFLGLRSRKVVFGFLIG